MDDFLGDLFGGLFEMFGELIGLIMFSSWYAFLATSSIIGGIIWAIVHFSS